MGTILLHYKFLKVKMIRSEFPVSGGVTQMMLYFIQIKVSILFLFIFSKLKCPKDGYTFSQA